MIFITDEFEYEGELTNGDPGQVDAALRSTWRRMNANRAYTTKSVAANRELIKVLQATNGQQWFAIFVLTGMVVLLTILNGVLWWML